MITRDNFTEVVQSLDAKDKKRILNSSKEFCVIELHIFNAGSYASIKLTDNYTRYQSVSNYGNAIVYTNEVQDILNN